MSEDQLSRANKAFERGNLSESERLYTRLRDSTEDRADEFMHAQALVGLGSIASARGDYFNALEMLNLALGIARNASDHRSHANALTSISEIHFARGEYEHAVRNATHAQQLAETSGHKATIASAVSARLVAATEVGETEVARELADRALQLRTEVGETTGVISAMANVAGLDITTGKVAVAMELLTRALGLSLEENLQWSKANVLTLVAAVHHLQSDYGQSIEVNLEALSLFEAIGDKRSIANTLNNVAVSRLAVDEVDEAWDAASRAQALYEELGTPKGCATALHNTGDIQFRRGNPSEAEKLITRAITINEKLGRKEDQASDFVLIAACRQQSGDHEGELQFLVRSKKTFDTLAQSPPDEWDLDSRIRTCRSRLSQSDTNAAEPARQDSPPLKVLEIAGCVTDEVIAWVKGNMGAAADHYLVLTADQLFWIEENGFIRSKSKKHALALDTIGSVRRKKGLVEDNLEIDSGGHLPERSFDHWRTQRKNMDTLLQALGKQVATVGDSDSSFRLPEIASVVRPLSLRLPVCTAILIAGLVQQVHPAVYLFPIAIFMMLGFNPRSKGSWHHSSSGGFRWRDTKPGWDVWVIFAWFALIIGIVLKNPLL